MEEKIIQEKRTFFEELVHFLKKKCSRDMEIDFREIIKTNDTKIPTIAMMKKEKNAVGRSFHANELYEYYRKGMSVEEIAENLIRLSEQDAEIQLDRKILTDILLYYPYMREGNITVRLLNFAENQEYLKNMCFIPYLDLAIVFYAVVSKKEETLATIPVTKEIFKNWDVTKEQLLSDTLSEMQRTFPVHMASLRKMVEEIMEERKQDAFADHMNPPEIPLDDIPDTETVLMATNESKINGAAVMLYPGFLKTVAKMLDSKEINILPSSIHELLLVPSTGETKRKEMVEMVLEVNRMCVSEEEKLSDNLYIYNADTDEVRIWDGKEQ